MTTIIAKVDNFFFNRRDRAMSALLTGVVRSSFLFIFTSRTISQILLVIQTQSLKILTCLRISIKMFYLKENHVVPIRSQCDLCKTTSDSNLVEIPLKPATLAALETEIGKFSRIVKSIPLLSIAQPKLQQ